MLPEEKLAVDPEAARQIRQQMQQQSVIRRIAAAAHRRGVSARESSAMRVSPFYEVIARENGKRIDLTPMLDSMWFAGYDGKKFEEVFRNAVRD